MAIKVVRNNAGNCINFVGSSNPVYWNSCLSGEVDSVDNTRVNVVNDVRTVEAGTKIYEFFQIPYTSFAEADGTAFTSATECATYITNQCNVASNTGQFILSSSDTLDFTLDATNTTILVNNGDAYSVNAIRAVANESSHINILQHTGDVAIFTDLRVANASINGSAVNSTLATAVNELNAFFQQSGGASGTAPVITSATTVNLTQGDTLNYELTATNGVAYEWTNLPSGVATVDGNVRKLIGGSSLAEATYTITAKAINYFGQDTETISLVVSAPPFSDTKSVKFVSGDYLGANASLLDSELGRSSNGSGSSDAWTVSWWFKAPAHTNNKQTMFYFGDNDAANGGRIRMRFVGSLNSMIFQYGSDNNNITWGSANNILPSEEWKHITMTYDGGTTGSSSGDISSYYSRFKFFIDGSEVTSNGTFSEDNYGYTASIDPDNLRVGREISGDYMKPNAFIDEMAVWDSDQSSNISLIYNSGTTHDLSNLTDAPSHYWHMGDGDTYPTIQDKIGTAHFVMYNMVAADIVTDAP